MEHTGTISVKELSLKTAIKPEDIRTTLEEHLNLIQLYHGQKAICADADVIKRWACNYGGGGVLSRQSNGVSPGALRYFRVQKSWTSSLLSDFLASCLVGS